MGDCYREQIVKIFQDAKLFEPKKIVASKRKGQKAQDFRNVIGDLKLVVLTFQSFNTDRLDEREPEIKSIFTAMREARKAKPSSDTRAPRTSSRPRISGPRK